MKVDTDKIKPVGHYIMLKIKNRAKEIEKSGIILSENAARNLDSGEKKPALVQAVGTDCKLGIEVGHEVIFRPVQVEAIKVGEEEDGSDLVLVPEHCIMAITNYVGSKK